MTITSKDLKEMYALTEKILKDRNAEFAKRGFPTWVTHIYDKFFGRKV